MTTTPPGDTTDDPTPVPGLTLQTLESMLQDVLHCDTPMRFLHSHTRWESQQGTGTEHHTTIRACAPCGATLTTTSTTPS